MSNVNLSGTGPGEVRLPATVPALQSQLNKALAQPDSQRREAVAKVVVDTITKVGAEGMKDMGKVMGMVSKQLAGQADGKTISMLVKKYLTA